jgi:hypothetical protein
MSNFSISGRNILQGLDLMANKAQVEAYLHGSATAGAKGQGGIDSSGNLTLDQFAASLARLGSNADLTFLVYAMEIRKMDQRVNEQIKGIQLTSKLRDHINERLNTLREMKAAISRDGGDEKKLKVTTLEEKTYQPITDEECKKIKEEMGLTLDYDARAADYNKHTAAVKKVLIKFDSDLNPETGQIEDRQVGTIGDDEVALSDLEAEEKRLESQIQKLDSDRELSMISLNSNISKKGQYVEWLSNVLKKTNDTSSAVIGNLR